MPARAIRGAAALFAAVALSACSLNPALRVAEVLPQGGAPALAVMELV